MAETQISEKSSDNGKVEDLGKLLKEVRWQLLDKGFEQGAATRYVSWIRSFILFHDRQQPEKLGIPEIERFLASGAFRGRGGDHKRAEAQRALKFFYEQVLRRLWPRQGRLAEQRTRRGTDSSKRRSAARSRGRYLNGTRQDIKLLDRVRNAIRVAQYAKETEDVYVSWNW